MRNRTKYWNHNRINNGFLLYGVVLVSFSALLLLLRWWSFFHFQLGCCWFSIWLVVFENIWWFLGASGLKVFVGWVFISVHLHVGHMTFFGASCLIHFDKSLKNIWMFVYKGCIFKRHYSILAQASAKLCITPSFGHFGASIYV